VKKHREKQTEGKGLTPKRISEASIYKVRRRKRVGRGRNISLMNAYIGRLDVNNHNAKKS
jgi:hypothetical protein